MAEKKGVGGRVTGALVGAAAAFVARKVLFFGWKQVTGKEPPEHPEDPQVALREALVWGVLLGAGVAAARTVATRVTNRHHSSAAGGDGGPPV